MLIPLAILQAVLLCAGQVFLKLGMTQPNPIRWDNGWLAACGLAFAGAGVLWAYILRCYPFAQAYPLSALAFVFGMLAAMYVFHESVSLLNWAGVLLIVIGCFLVSR